MAQAKTFILLICMTIGTMIGPSILYLPVNISLHKFLAIVIILIITSGLTYIGHSYLFKIMHEQYHSKIEAYLIKLIQITYSFITLMACLIYAIGITSTIYFFINHNLGYNASLHTISFFTILAMVLITYFNKNILLVVNTFLAIPLLICILVIAYNLSPWWNIQIDIPSGGDIYQCFQDNIVLLLIAYNFIASIVIQNKMITNMITKHQYIFFVTPIVATLLITFFLFSIKMTLSYDQLLYIREHNISVLSYLSQVTDNSILFNQISFVIVITAILTSFITHFITIKQSLMNSMPIVKKRKDQDIIISTIMILLMYVSATNNFDVLDAFKLFVGPAVLLGLYIIPSIILVNRYIKSYLKAN